MLERENKCNFRILLKQTFLGWTNFLQKQFILHTLFSFFSFSSWDLKKQGKKEIFSHRFSISPFLSYKYFYPQPTDMRVLKFLEALLYIYLISKVIVLFGNENYYSLSFFVGSEHNTIYKVNSYYKNNLHSYTVFIFTFVNSYAERNSFLNIISIFKT